MINPQWLELFMSRTNLYGPKGVRTRLYTQIYDPDKHVHLKSTVRIHLTIWVYFAKKKKKKKKKKLKKDKERQQKRNNNNNKVNIYTF